MLSNYASNVISAKVRAMYGKRITSQDYNNLMACATVTDVAVYLKNNTHYSSELAGVNELDINRNQLENIIRKKLFHELEMLCRYEISTGNSLAEYTIVRTEIEQLIHSLMYLASGNPYGYIYSLPMFFNKRTKIDLLGLTSIKNYDDFLMLCRQLNIEDAQSIQKYNHLKNKIAKGYTFIHEILFYEFTKKEYKKK